MYSRWLRRTESVDGTDVEDREGLEYLGEAAFADPNGRMMVDPAMDLDFEKEFPSHENTHESARNLSNSLRQVREPEAGAGRGHQLARGLHEPDV